MAYVIFGALLSRVTMSTGIAETIIAYAAEFGGDRPLVVALILSAAVAALFTSLYGLGSIIMVGSIVLPIMLTIGIPRRTAATLFMLAYGLGFIFNVSQWGFYTKTFGVPREQMQSYALVLAAIDLLALIVVRRRALPKDAGLRDLGARSGRAARAQARSAARRSLRPILPIVLYFVFGFDPVLAFVLAALYGVLTTRPREAVPVLVGSAIRGVEDVAPAILLFMGIGMLLVATGSAQRALRARAARDGDRAAQRLRLRCPLRLAEPARALPRTAQSVRRRNRGLYGARRPGDLAAGLAGRGGHGRRASSERLRSDEHAERLGRELHRAFRSPRSRA